jgi:hypothetical protein
MKLTIEFFIGMILIFTIGYLLATVLEKAFHLDLNNSKKHE